jgi:hypothetical protein
MLVAGLICNMLVRPLSDRWFMTADELAGGPYKIRQQHFLASALTTIGAVLLALALAWWALFYSRVGDLQAAIPCIINTGPACGGMSAGSGLAGYLAYNPPALWIALGCITIGLAARLLPSGGSVITQAAAQQARAENGGVAGGSYGIGTGGLDVKAALFWLFVGIPIGWGVWITLKNALRIF